MNTQLQRLSRRDVLKFFAAAAAFSATKSFDATAAYNYPPKPTYMGVVPIAKGYGTDPNLLKDYKPGDVWPLTFSDAQRMTAAALADAILPADEFGPSASSLRVQDYIDEWISAPYVPQQESRTVILEGLTWLDAESQKRFRKNFADASPAQQHEILTDICDKASAKEEFKTSASFFFSFRNLACGAYYATPQGWKAIGYVGNIPLAKFDGPPPEILAKLGLEQTVK